MEDAPLISGLSETQADTEPLSSRLADLLSKYPSRSQDCIESGLAHLEKACTRESNPKLRHTLERAIKLLRYGGEQDDRNQRLYEEDVV